MVEQNALDALAIADRGYLLVDGSNAREGRAQRLGGGRRSPSRIPWGLIAAIIGPTPTGGSHASSRSLITRRKALLTGAGAIAAPFVVTTPGFGQTGPIKLAGLVSLTGSGSPFGPNSRMAHQAVVDQVNAAGGLLGRKIEYLAEDDQTNAEAGVRARAQADRRRQGRGDHERVGLRGRHARCCRYAGKTR